MARARNIKPGFFKNELLVEMGAFDRLLFIGLWLLADREGRIEDRPKRIKLELFPCDTYDVDAGLTLLANVGFVKRYTINVKSVISIESFHKHQTPHGSEKDSELPDCDGNMTINDRDSNGYITGKKRINTPKAPINVKSEVSNGGLQDEHAHLPVSNTLNPESLNPDSPNPDLKGTIVPLSAARLPDCPHQKILELFKTRLPSLSQPRSWEGDRVANLRSRWRQCAAKSAYSEGYRDEDAGVRFWDSLFEHIATGTTLMAGYDSPGRHWQPDLPWICKASNFQKIIDGKYDIPEKNTIGKYI